MKRYLTAIIVAIGGPAIAIAADGSNTIYGVDASPNITTGHQNTALGLYAGHSLTSGGANTAVGANALEYTNSGQNTAVGTLAGHDALGSGNTVLGYYAFSGFLDAVGSTPVTGDSNVVVGANAMQMVSGGGASDNVAVGNESLYSATNGSQNTAVGYVALHDNTLGNYNVAIGTASLQHVVTGSYNTSVGTAALQLVSGNYNTGVGYAALLQSTTDGSTAIGSYALSASTTGPYNTAVGNYALNATTTGGDNVGIGAEALRYNVTGSSNMALGRSAMRNSTSGGFNSMLGYASCWSCRSASQNVGIGFKTLYNLAGGTHNVAIGNQAGYNVSGSNSNNVDIANTGMANDSGVIRIGAESAQTKAYIAGVATSKANWAAVYINQDGQLGTQASALRYKEQVQSLGDPSEKLSRLRPVRFHLKSDPKGPVQYGLIAEEVSLVFPELVIRDAKGDIQGVRYDELAPMLLKQLQNLQAEHASDQVRLRDQDERMARLEAEAARQKDVEARLVALEAMKPTVAGLASP